MFYTDLKTALEVRGLNDFEGAFAAARQGRAEGLTVLAGPVTGFHQARLVDRAAQSRLPTIDSERVFVEAGGLMSYAVSSRDMNRRAAYYVDRILKGTNPADLPVEQPGISANRLYGFERFNLQNVDTQTFGRRSGSEGDLRARRSSRQEGGPTGFPVVIGKFLAPRNYTLLYKQL
jgi:hypothetical protein